MASEGGGTPGGGGGGPKKNSPQDYLFGRIIGEGEILMYFLLKRQSHAMARTIWPYYVGLGLEKPTAFGSQLAGCKFNAVKDSKTFSGLIFYLRDFRRNCLTAVSERCLT
jgi:hypothetical protein